MSMSMPTDPIVGEIRKTVTYTVPLFKHDVEEATAAGVDLTDGAAMVDFLGINMDVAGSYEVADLEVDIDASE